MNEKLETLRKEVLDALDLDDDGGEFDPVGEASNDAYNQGHDDGGARLAAENASLRADLEEAREAIRWCYEESDAPFPSITERAVTAIFAPDTILPAVKRALEETKP